MRKPLLSFRFFMIGKSLGRRIVRPFHLFTAVEASGGIALLFATVVGMIWANSCLGPLYQAIFHAEITVSTGGHSFSRSVHFWINDGLMTIFFFLVALEIKAEVLVGELSSLARITMPALAALGGMVVPAAIYAVFNGGTPAGLGWAIPMATDIGFVVGALTLLGSRVPSFLPVFLVSLAIFDDLGAVIVIALFYGGALNMEFLAMATAVFAALLAVNFLGFRRPLPYLILGVMLWACVYLSGIHATVAGVLLGLTIPARSGWSTSRFVDEAFTTLKRFVPGGERHYTLHLDGENHEVVQEMEGLLERVEPPLQRIERTLHPWVSFGVMPLFALANCGVTLNWSVFSETITSPLSLGIILGLFLGKQIGIFGVTWLLVRTGMVTMPEGMGMKHVYGGALLCGIGFTMSLFISDLSFAAPELKETAKISILIASFLSAVAGMIVLFLCGEGEEVASVNAESKLQG